MLAQTGKTAWALENMKRSQRTEAEHTLLCERQRKKNATKGHSTGKRAYVPRSEKPMHNGKFSGERWCNNKNDSRLAKNNDGVYSTAVTQNKSQGLYLWCGKKWHAAMNTSKVARSNVENFGECKSCKAEQS